MLVVVALVTPVADVAVFGIHDHVSVSAREQGSLTATGADLAPSHHCELVMSPGARLQVDEFPAPWAVASPPDAQAALLASHSPVVPFGPPRA
jgi:hypothetical protein